MPFFRKQFIIKCFQYYGDQIQWFLHDDMMAWFLHDDSLVLKSLNR